MHHEERSASRKLVKCAFLPTNNYRHSARRHDPPHFLSKRELRLLAETEKLGTDTVISSDWHDMPGVAREYQSVVSGDQVKVDEVEGFDVMASEHGDGPVISFEEKPSPQADCETGDFDNLPR